jgi:hypothetical protein
MAKGWEAKNSREANVGPAASMISQTSTFDARLRGTCERPELKAAGL